MYWWNRIVVWAQVPLFRDIAAFIAAISDLDADQTSATVDFRGRRL